MQPEQLSKEISGSEMAETIIPIPPLNEQSKIVEKVNTAARSYFIYRKEPQLRLFSNKLQCMIALSDLRYN